MPERIRAAVHAYVRDISGQPGLALAADTLLADIGDMDSLKWIETIAVLEERLGVAVDTLEMENLSRVEDIVDLLARAAARTGG